MTEIISNSDFQILAPRKVRSLLEVSRTTLWRLERNGFPKPVRISQNRVGYVASEVYGWIEERRKERAIVEEQT